MGDLIQLEVAGDMLDSVEIERLDRIDGDRADHAGALRGAGRGTPGVYPIRLIEADRRIGRLEITAVGGRRARAACASWPGMNRPVPSHHGQSTGSDGSPPLPEITWPVPRQAWQRSGS